MPRAPRRCAGKDCENRITNAKYCPEHTTVNWGTGSSTRTSSSVHIAWRERILKRDNHQCQIKGPTCIGTATEADHILCAAEGGKETDDNGQAAYVPCHKRKTQSEAVRGQRRALGLPQIERQS